jgi:hypothetical protein
LRFLLTIPLASTFLRLAPSFLHGLVPKTTAQVADAAIRSGRFISHPEATNEPDLDEVIFRSGWSPRAVRRRVRCVVPRRFATDSERRRVSAGTRYPTSVITFFYFVFAVKFLRDRHSRNL